MHINFQPGNMNKPFGELCRRWKMNIKMYLKFIRMWTAFISLRPGSNGGIACTK